MGDLLSIPGNTPGVAVNTEAWSKIFIIIVNYL